ncbi:MFS general substrate transporter [Coccomyxa subellipsoidea C-169]|uniref:MFS general substrate transporter n=1 Tax=Coccomyxa subellipsoidea (strain C-169) TaxID=574566 RepID=I0YXW1_COCSC|nr:MFS general substrate transporter [Coccomyxa subellipsoidea C-169]EIE23230.1 MFS general substrate transporter [Coccomyxa subellipsoidea C-169]|eukprot:XP_005647774.1 MFS general substrate transporter [Coccomyxa subellipsoidea C-169]
MTRPPSSTGDSLLTELWKRGVWRVLPILFFYVTSLTVLAPVKPSIMTDFFASRAANQTMRCDDFLLTAVPKACQDAHAQVVTWSSWSDFVANSVLAFFMAPVVGRWSDAYGRKPFLVLSFACGGAQVVALLLYITWGTSLFWYFPASALVGAFSCISICLAYVADVMPARHRGATFGFIMASFSFGVVIGPMAGAVLSPLAASWFAVGGAAFNCVYTVLLLPESLSAEARKLARRRQGREASRPLTGLCSGLRMLGRSPLFLKLTACVMLTGIVMEGMYELLGQYFQLKLAYTAADQSLMLVVAGAAGLVVNTVVLRYLLHCVGETGVLYIGLVVSCLQQLCIAFAWTKPLSIAAVAIGALGNITFPAISSIKSKSVPRHEQGAMQGALFGARSLATGMGPVIFASIFSVFSRSDSRLPFFPGAPFIAGAALCGVGLIVALTIRTSDVRNCAVDDGLTAPLLDGEDQKGPLHADLEAGGDEHQRGSKGDIPSVYLEPDAAQLPVSHPADAALAADTPVIIAIAADTEQARSHAYGAAQPEQAASATEEALASSLEASQSQQGTPRPSTSQPDTAVRTSTAAGTSTEGSAAQGRSLARKKSVRFADTDTVSVRAALAAATAACSGTVRPLPGRAAGQPGPGTGAPLPPPQPHPQPAFCWRVLDESVPGDILDVRLDDGGYFGNGLEPEEALLPRRSVDLRMADAATLPMAAFGGNGMETSSAVLRSLQASHERR